MTKDVPAGAVGLLHHRDRLPPHGVTGVADQKRATGIFGTLSRVPYIEPSHDDPDIVAVLKEADETKISVFGGDWHSDFSFLEKPPAGSVLYSVEVPPYGGDTIWANQIAAYEALPADLREIVDGRGAVHTGAPYGVFSRRSLAHC